MKKIEKQSKPILYRVIQFFSHRFDLINLQLTVAVNLCVITHKLKLPILVYSSLSRDVRKRKILLSNSSIVLDLRRRVMLVTKCVILVVEDDEGDEEGRTTWRSAFEDYVDGERWWKTTRRRKARA